MKVLHVFKTAEPFTQGGLEESIRQICRNMAGPGRAFEVACIGPGPRVVRQRADYATVVGYPADLRVSSCPMSLRMLPALWRAREACDIVHVHSPWPFAELAYWLRPGGRAKRVLTYHADVVNRGPLARAYQPWLRRALEGFDAVVATSDGYIDSSPVLSRLPRRPEVIPLGIDPDSYPAPEPARIAAWRKRLGEDFFLFVGVLRHYKGLDVLLRAAEGFHGQIVIAGDGPEGDRLRRAAADRPNVHVLGHVADPDKMALLSLARAVVLPSTARAEAFGISLLEGAMCGRPLISTDLGTGTSLVNRDGVTGFVVPPNDPGALRAAMTRLQSPDLAAELGEAARRRFHERFQGRRMAAAYLALYERLLARPELPAAA